MCAPLVCVLVRPVLGACGSYRVKRRRSSNGAEREPMPMSGPSPPRAAVAAAPWPCLVGEGCGSCGAAAAGGSVPDHTVSSDRSARASWLAPLSRYNAVQHAVRCGVDCRRPASPTPPHRRTDECPALPCPALPCKPPSVCGPRAYRLTAWVRRILLLWIILQGLGPWALGIVHIIGIHLLRSWAIILHLQ